MRLVLTLAAIAAFIAVYIIWIRPYLKTLPSWSEAWQREATTWAAFKVWLDGRRTILIGIWGELVAFLPDMLQSASGFDLKTLLFLPDMWAAWVTAFIPVLMLIFRAKAKDA